WLTKNPWLPGLKELARSVTTITVSDLSRDLYCRLGWPEEHTVSIPNGVDTERSGIGIGLEKGEREKESRDGLKLGTIARLTEDKGIDVLIDAITDLPQVSLTVIGEGSEEGYLRKLVDERGLADRVQIIPDVDDLGAFYRSIDVFILPSRLHDPFGLVAAEAMMLGIPAIITNQCGIARHLVAGREALVVEADSIAQLNSAIVEMEQRDRRLALAHAGTYAARERFSLERMMDRYEKILKGSN
ncbi:MAG: glycosyltransferase family 4 protein, partial [Candidatus Peribacteraceae bacterium]|nr:glycosyltransferase family 4 protein [Candidatus Peribacteraceae bacterium]